MPDLRVAIIGYGLAGRSFHAPLIASTPGLSVATVVTGNPERKAQVASEHPDAVVMTSPDQLWEHPTDHDLLVVATPPDSHVGLATQAIDHTLPVVVDKPLAASADDAERLITHAEEAGVFLTVFHNRRWDSDHLTLRRLRDEGRLGEVMRYESRFERWRPSPRKGSWRATLLPQQGGGQLVDLGSHMVDQALVLFGGVTHVYAEIESRPDSSADDDAFVALRHETGVVSHLHASEVTAAPGPRLRVLGTQAGFIAPALDGQEGALRRGDRPDTKPDWGAEPESSWGRLVMGEDSIEVQSERGDWPHFYAAVARALREGGPPPVEPHDAVVALSVIEAARRSASSRAVVPLAP